MSLNWEWKDKMGTCTYEDGTKCNLYRGNAFTIAVYEDEKENTYQMVWFAADEAHMKNMLGLNKKLAKTSDTPGRTRLINYFDYAH